MRQYCLDPGVRIVAVLMLLCALGVSGCFFDAISRDVVYPYRLLAVDDPEYLAVMRDPNHDGGVLRIAPTVVEVGWDDRYLVAARRPGEPGSDLLYYYIDMAKDDGGGPSDDFIFGPFTEQEFAVLKTEMNLPEFTVHYPELR